MADDPIKQETAQSAYPQGFLDLCRNDAEWICSCYFDATWHGTVYRTHMHCTYSGQIVWKVKDMTLAYRAVRQELDRQPELKDWQIEDLFNNRIEEQLSYEFEEYVECGDAIHGPILTDYSLEFEAEEICKSLGLQILEQDGSADSPGYE